MREIKFRVWSLGSGKMRYWDELQKLHVHTVFKMMQPECALMQYTGLKDKNGIEVYEGDIVKWRCLDELCFDITNRPMKIDAVKYVNGHFWPVSSPTHTCYYSVDDPEFEVIGNIYENPELKD